MCGITVFFGDRTVANLYTYFKRGTKRGPEQYNYECNQDVHMGFHRLAINGLDKESSQPLHFKRYVLVCNGEIYNHKELVEKYKFKMETNSDCEVILKLYDLLREHCVYELDGEYSFVIHDLEDDHIFVARDPYGVRPLYINHVKDSYCLSSDLFPMSFQPMNTVEHFPPGHYAKFTKHLWGYEKEITRYHSNVPHESTYEEVYQALCNAVHKRVKNTERPVACLLSGGLDSSLVAALASRYCKKYDKTLETYSIGLSGSEDLKFSSKVAEHIGSKHTQILCSEDEFIYSIPQVIKDIESYDTTTVRASVGNWNVGKYIREHSDAKVVLNGDGADELMGGYLYFHACPDSTEFDQECHRLLENIHCFDVLRSDKSISSHGLEARTPYLDKDFVNAYLSLPLDVRYNKGQIEKQVIRSIIKVFDADLIPKEVLFRKKEAFSDGVSSLQRSWYQTIQERIPSMERIAYPHNQPQTDEQYYYRSLFEQYHKGCERVIPYFWMPRYVNATDASARTLSQYKESNPLNE